jgi:tripartite-type tricarboxylate transporter receptor subunit TctC
VVGRQGLQIAAVASPERLSEFPEVPTFKELGYDSLTGESLWRGFAVRKGVTLEKTKVLRELFQKVMSDEEWLEYLKTNAVRPFDDTSAQFAAAIEKQIASDKEHLQS